MNRYNLDDLNTIIKSSDYATKKETPTHTLSYITPLSANELEKTIKKVCFQLDIKLDDDLIHTIRREVGQQPFDLVFIKNGKNETTKLSNRDTLLLLNPLIYQNLLVDKDAGFAVPTLDRRVKITKTHALIFTPTTAGTTELIFPQLNQIGLKSINKTNLTAESVNELWQRARKIDPKIDFDYSEESGQVAIYYELTPEQIDDFANFDISKMQIFFKNETAKAEEKLSPIYSEFVAREIKNR